MRIFLAGIFTLWAAAAPASECAGTNLFHTMPPDQRAEIDAAVESATGLPAWAIPEDAELAAPLLRTVLDAVDAELLRGDEAALSLEARIALFKAQAKAAAGKAPSAALAAVIGNEPVARPEAVKKMWEYIKAHNLQNPENKREILADDKLEKVFGTKKVTMFEMNKHLSAHLTAKKA